MAGWNPRMLSVQVPNTVGGTQLYTLIHAIDATIGARVSSLWLEMDLAATGNIYVGNKTVAVSSTNCGMNLVPGTVRQLIPGVGSLILLSDIYVLATVNNAQLNVSLIPNMM